MNQDKLREALEWIAHHCMQKGCSKETLQGVATKALNDNQSQIESIWHDVSEECIAEKELLIFGYGVLDDQKRFHFGEYKYTEGENRFINQNGEEVIAGKYAYLSDLLTKQ